MQRRELYSGEAVQAPKSTRTTLQLQLQPQSRPKDSRVLERQLTAGFSIDREAQIAQYSGLSLHIFAVGTKMPKTCHFNSKLLFD